MISSRISTSDFWNRRVLFLSTYKGAVYHWHKGELGSSYLFDVDKQGRQSFQRYLQESPNTPMHILVDVFEEEYKRDSIPHVFGADRQALINRKQARLFHNASYCYSEIQGREEEGRRDDRVFFSAITNPDIIQPWVSLLDTYKVPLAGISSLPLYTQSLLDNFTDLSNQILIVSLQSISGLRQTFFYQNEFMISRLVQLPRFGTASYAPYIGEEVEKITRYLNSLRLTSEDSPLDVYFLLAGELLDELRQEYTGTEMVRYHLLDLNDLLAESGLSSKVTTPFSDQYFVHEFLKKPAANRYAAPAERRYHKLRNIRHAMTIASVLLVMCSVIWSGMNLYDAMVYKQESLAADSKTRFYTQRYETARARLPRTPVEPEDLKAAVDIVDVLKDYKSSPIDLVRVLSDTLEKYPNIKLDNVDWLSSTDPNQLTGDIQSRFSNQGLIDVSDRGDDANRYRYYEIGVFTGHLDKFNGNYREAIATVNEFTEILRIQEDVYDISILTLPIDVSSSVNLQGDTRSIAKQAVFSMRLILGIGSEI